MQVVNSSFISSHADLTLILCVYLTRLFWEENSCEMTQLEGGEKTKQSKTAASLDVLLMGMKYYTLCSYRSRYR